MHLQDGRIDQPLATSTASLTIMFGILAATDHYAIVSSMIVRRARRNPLF